MKISDGAELLLLAALWGGSFLFMRVASPVLGPVWLIESRVLLAGLALLPLLLRFNLPQAILFPKIILAVLALALLSTAIAYILYFRLIRNIGATKALTVTYLIPLFAMLWGTIALGEPITTSMMIGCGFVLTGTAIANG